MIRRTLNTQRSFDNSWTLQTNHGFPSGVIVDLQVTLPSNTRSKVYLTSFRVDSTGTTYVALSRAGELIATAYITQYELPVALDCIPGVTAHILIGVMPTTPGEYVTAGIEINPALVSVYEAGDQAIKSTELELVLNGTTIYSEELTETLTLTTDGPDLTLRYDGLTGTATIAAVDQADTSIGVQPAQPESVAIDRPITSINHVFGSTITVNVELPRLSADADGAHLWGELETTALTPTATLYLSDEGNSLLAPIDLIDRHIKPERGRSYQYLPLDDAYFDIAGGTVGESRNMTNLSGGTYTFPLITNAELSGATTGEHDVTYTKCADVRFIGYTATVYDETQEQTI